MYLLPPIPFGIWDTNKANAAKYALKKDLHTEVALNVWFYTLQISTDCYWLQTLRLVIVTETEPFCHGIQLAIFNSLVVFTGVDLQMFGARNPNMDVNTEKNLWETTRLLSVLLSFATACYSPQGSYGCSLKVSSLELSEDFNYL